METNRRNGKISGGGYDYLKRNSEKCLKAVVIGASADSVYAIETAKKEGVYVYAIDGNPEAEGLKTADIGIVCDISDIHKTEKAVSEIKPDFMLTTPIGCHLYTTACINDSLGLKGIKKDFTKLSVDKFEFHNFLNKRGLRNVKAYLLKSDDNIKKHYDIKFPAIAKPRYGSGSRDVFYIKNQNELDKALEEILGLKEDFVLEECVAGQEYGVDAAIINGKYIDILIRKKLVTPLPQRQAVGSITFDDPELKKEITSYVKKVCDTMGYNDCLINSDIIINDNGEVFIVEISPRPSGHYLYDKFVPFASGVDMTKEYINYMKFGYKSCNFKPVYTKKAVIRYFDFEDMTVSYVPEEEKVRKNIDCKLIEWKCNIQKGDYMCEVKDGHSIMGKGYFILEGDNDEKLMEEADKVLSLFR